MTDLTGDMGNTILGFVQVCCCCCACGPCGQRACVVHKSTAAWRLRLLQAVAAMSDDAERDRAVADVPGAVLGFGEADRLAGQRAR